MKERFHPLILFVIVLVANTAIAQKYLQLPAELKNQEMLPVYPGNNYKFSITDWKTVSSKTGWTSTTTKGEGQSFISQLFSKNSVVTQKDKGSFILVNKNGDSTIINTAANTTLSYSDASRSIFQVLQNEKRYLGGSAKFIATIETTLDTSKWVLTTLETEQVKDKTFGWEERVTGFTGWLISGSQKIQLQEVKEFAEGKKLLYGGILGVVFTENSKPILAVQFYTGSLKKNMQHFVWLDATESPARQSVLLAAAVALLRRDLQTRNETIESSVDK